MRSTAAEDCRCGGRRGTRVAGQIGHGRLQIAVGVVCDPDGTRVLLARRRAGSPHAGLWEFPGGKCREDERLADALRRELKEETNIVVQGAEPLLCIDFDYPASAVRLHIWRVYAWSGAPRGREGQEIEWVTVADLRSRQFPEANRAIVATLTIPPLYVITPDLDRYDAEFLTVTRSLLNAGARLVQFRSTRLPEKGRADAIRSLADLCRAAGADLLVNGTISEAMLADTRGLHLSASRLLQTNERPLDARYVIGASCHNRMELEHAGRLGLDFAVLGPIRRTRTHPEAEPLGWRRFRSLAARTVMPVYALGGISPADMAVAKRNGAHGIAMIGGIWSAADPAAAVAACVGPGRY